MRRALQAVENLTQWSVIAEHCGETTSASHIRQSTMHAIQKANISSGGGAIQRGLWSGLSR
jgi:hypothetical protein